MPVAPSRHQRRHGAASAANQQKLARFLSAALDAQRAGRVPRALTLCESALELDPLHVDALCLYAWHPYMYNPQLPRWLGRIAVPTLVLWGDSDGIVSPDYGRAYAGLIPGARFETIAACGHHPEIERPDELAARIVSFVGS